MMRARRRRLLHKRTRVIRFCVGFAPYYYYLSVHLLFRVVCV